MTDKYFDEHSPEYAQALAGFESGDKSKLGVIFIEDITDKPFWQKIAYKHEVKLYSEKGQAITGKSKLLQICSQNQLIAIDSDFDWICPNHRDESALCSEKKDFILQTYAHGCENLVLSPEYLHDVLNQHFKLYLDNHDNRIQEIVQKLADCWFESYRKFLFLMNNQFDKFTHDDWMKAIIFQGKESQEIALQLDFTKYQKRLLELDNQLNQYVENKQDYQKFCEDLTNLGFETQRVYGFIRCHDWESQFVLPIMKEISNARMECEKAHIDKIYSNNRKANSDGKKHVSNYFKEKNNLTTVLNLQFDSHYFEKACVDNFFIQKIVQDYERIIGNA